MTRIILTEIYTTGNLWWKARHEADLLLSIDQIGPVESNSKGGSYVNCEGGNAYEVKESPRKIHIKMMDNKKG